MLTTFGQGTRYTTVSGAVDSLKDQSGNSRHLEQGTSTKRPLELAGAAAGRVGASFDGTDDDLRTAAAISSLITNSAGYIICSFFLDDSSTNALNFNDNDALFADSGNFISVSVKDTGAGHQIGAYNWDGSADVTSPLDSIATGAAHVVEWKHEGGTLSMRLDKGTWRTATSGNTQTMTGTLVVGGEVSGGITNWLDFKLMELAVFNAVPTATQQDFMANNMKAWVGI